MDIEKMTIIELVNYVNACDILITKKIKGSDYYRTANTNMSATDYDRMCELEATYKKYTTVENKILSEIEKRVLEVK